MHSLTLQLCRMMKSFHYSSLPLPQNERRAGDKKPINHTYGDNHDGYRTVILRKRALFSTPKPVECALPSSRLWSLAAALQGEEWRAHNDSSHCPGRQGPMTNSTAWLLSQLLFLLPMSSFLRDTLYNKILIC